MANVIAYKTSQPTKTALKKGNLVIGVDGNQEYGPTSTTNYINGVLPPNGGYIVYTLSSANNPIAYAASDDSDLLGIAKDLGGDVHTPLEAKHYLAGRSNTYVLNNIPDSTITSGLRLVINSSHMSSYVDNIAITNLTDYPSMKPPTSGSIITSTSAPQNNVGSSGWTWSVYPNSNIHSNGGVEWLPTVLGPLGEEGAWLLKRRPGGNSERNFQRSSTNMIPIDSTKSYIVSLWCKTSDAGMFRIHINTTQDGNSYWGYASSTHNGDGKWQRLSVTIPANAGNTSINTLRAQAIGATNTGDAFVKYFQVEEGESSTDWVSGSRDESTSWKDLSGYGNDFEHFENVTFDNECFNFNGTDSELSGSISSFNPDSQDSVIECLFKPMSGSGQQAIFTDNYGPEYGFWIRANGQLRGIAYATVDTDVTVGRWNHAVLNIDPGANKNSDDQTYVRLYLNGDDKGQSNANTGNGLNDQPFTLGYDYKSGSPTGYFSGSIASVKVYYGEFDQDDVNHIYYRGNIVTSNLTSFVDAGNLVSYESGSTTTYGMVPSTDANGTLTNGVAYDNSNGGCWEFDGSDDYITFGNNFAYTSSDDFSIEVWCNPDNVSSGFRHITGVTFSSYRLAQNGNKITFRLDSNTISTNSGTLVAGEWTHIVALWDSTAQRAKVYQDGVEIANVYNSNIDYTHNSANYQLGNSPGESYYFNGKIAMNKVYNKVLSPGEILQNYGAHKSRFNHE